MQNELSFNELEIGDVVLNTRLTHCANKVVGIKISNTQYFCFAYESILTIRNPDTKLYLKCNFNYELQKD